MEWVGGKATRGLCWWCVPQMEEIIAFCFGNEFIESGSSLKHQIPIKCSSWTELPACLGQRIPLFPVVGKITLHARWMAQSLCLIQKSFSPRSMNIFKLLSTVLLHLHSNELWLLEVFSLPFKDNKVHQLSRTFRRVTRSRSNSTPDLFSGNFRIL